MLHQSCCKYAAVYKKGIMNQAVKIVMHFCCTWGKGAALNKKYVCQNNN
jgi:hypothetical protein